MAHSSTLMAVVLLLLVLATAADWQTNEGGKTQVSSSRVVNTRKGSLRGLYQAFEDKTIPAVELFLGVPYASPPVGSLRFMPPVTVSPWRGIRQADRYGPVCPQRFPDITNETEALKRMPRGRLETLKKLAPLLTNQSEDCLYLNIFTPYSSKRSISSVFFFLVPLSSPDSRPQQRGNRRSTAESGIVPPIKRKLFACL